MKLRCWPWPGRPYCLKKLERIGIKFSLQVLGAKISRKISFFLHFGPTIPNFLHYLNIFFKSSNKNLWAWRCFAKGVGVSGSPKNRFFSFWPYCRFILYLLGLVYGCSCLTLLLFHLYIYSQLSISRIRGDYFLS